ncbi:MAG: hypothetical protein K2L98_03030, partial [Bacilli bacterium]|nr:hypothetical protein [Bacilli bacterium]
SITSEKAPQPMSVTPENKPSDITPAVPVQEPKKEELNISEKSFVAKENIVDSPTGGIGFNPFNIPSEAPKSEGKFFNHDVIQGTDEVVETSPIVAPVIDKKETVTETKTDAIETFADLVNQKEPPLPASKPAIMVENPIDTETKAPVLPDEPIIKPPMSENMASPLNINPLNPMSNQSVPFVPAEPVKPAVENIMPSNMMSDAENNTSKSQTTEQNISPEPSKPTPQSVPSSSNNNVSDDAFFDDFFDD